MGGFRVVESVAEESDDSVAEEVDQVADGENREVLQDFQPCVVSVGEEVEETDQRQRDEHDGCDGGQVLGVGEVGVAQHAVHGPVVDGRLEQGEKGDLLSAEEEADEEDGENDESEVPARGLGMVNGYFVIVLHGQLAVGEEAFPHYGRGMFYGGALPIYFVILLKSRIF